MDNTRFPEPSHPYRLERFDELGAFIFGPDGRCTCTVADYCPNRRKGCEERCTFGGLSRLNSEAVSRRAWQSGED